MPGSLAKIRSHLRALAVNQDGQVAILFAVGAIPLVGLVGAAVDFSSGSRVRTDLQAALDNAVLAAAIDGSPNWQDVALRTFNADVSVKSPGTSTSSVAFTKSDAIYSGTIVTSMPTSFLSVVGFQSIPIQANAAATTGTLPLCVLGLNTFDNGAFDMNGNSVFNAPGCAVQSNTSANKGMTQEGQPTAKASKFNVSGGYTGSGYSTTPQAGATAVPDPYANMPFPSHDTCDTNPKGLVIDGGTQTLWPGTYCGGLTIKGQATVTLNPGIYVMVNGSLLLDGGSSLNGKEVMIAFTGTDTTLRIWGNSTLNLTSPTSGTYANFQFFQDAADQNGRDAWVSIGGNGNNSDSSKATWDGIAYFPTQNFWVHGNSVVNANSPSMAIVTGQIWDQGNATINITANNTRGLNVAQTVVAGSARLVH